MFRLRLRLLLLHGYILTDSFPVPDFSVPSLKAVSLARRRRRRHRRLCYLTPRQPCVMSYRGDQ
jgi:hypothetical protein